MKWIKIICYDILFEQYVLWLSTLLHCYCGYFLHLSSSYLSCTVGVLTYLHCYATKNSLWTEIFCNTTILFLRTSHTDVSYSRSFLFLSQKNPEAPSSKKHSCANICVSLLYYNPSHQPCSVPLLMQQQLKSWLLQRRKKKTWRKSAETSLQNGLWHKKVVTLDHFRAFLFAHHLVTSKRPNSSKKRPSSMWVLWQLSDQWT